MKANGSLIDGVIAVDLWRKEDVPGPVRLFFLSHLHADHIIGLTSVWSRGVIYTSPLNVKLAPKFLPYTVCRLLIPLQLDVPHLLSLGDDADDPKVRVVLMDANHVPGAVMFLFRGFFGHVLYTGDFRYRSEMLQNAALNEVVRWEDVDRVFLDNTFLSPECTFPSRSEVVTRLLKFVRDHPYHFIYFGCRRLGKERVLKQLTVELNEKICADGEKLALFDLMDLNGVLTDDAAQSRIFLVDQHLLTRKFLENENEKRPTLGIILSGLFYGWPDQPYRNSEAYGLHVFEYSDHSSYAEIVEFVKRVRPKKLLPLVQSGSASGYLKHRDDFLRNRVDMSLLSEYLSDFPEKEFVVPKIIGLPTFRPTSSVTNTRRNAAIIQQSRKRTFRGRKGAVLESSSQTNSSTLAEQVSLEDVSNCLEDICYSLQLSKTRDVPLSTLNALKGTLNRIEEQLAIQR